MTIIVFVGPTLSLDECRASLEAEYLPPAAQGDVYRAALEKPAAIGIVDGYFERMPSVCHKEILWALSQGIAVYGSSSMGALRAAELSTFGMVGVGRIFDGFASGEYEDDDEVAVAHGVREDRYRATSEAMVNIRRTLARAVDERVLSAESATVLERIGKDAFYADRSFPLLLSAGAKAGLPSEELLALRQWLPTGAVNQKRLDALSMLERMRAASVEAAGPKNVGFAFEYTAAWESTRRSVDTSPNAEALGPGVPSEKRPSEDAVLEELRVSGEFTEAQRAAMARALAVEQARHFGRIVEGRALHDAIEVFRRSRQLIQDAAFEQWLEEQEIYDIEFFKQEAQARAVDVLFQQEATRMLPDYLRSTGDYGRLLARAREKGRVLGAVDLTKLTARDASISEPDLFAWYFKQHLRQPVPPDLDSYAQQVGMPDSRALYRAVLREFIYLRASTISQTT